MRAGDLPRWASAELPDPVAATGSPIRATGASLRGSLAGLVAAHAPANPLAPGLPLEAARAALGLPDRQLVRALARPPLKVSDGMIGRRSRPARPAGAGPAGAVAAGGAGPCAPTWPRRPFGAPEAARLRELGLDSRAIAAAAAARAAAADRDQIVLAPGADVAAGERPGRAGAAVHRRAGAGGARHDQADR